MHARPIGSKDIHHEIDLITGAFIFVRRGSRARYDRRAAIPRAAIPRIPDTRRRVVYLDRECLLSARHHFHKFGRRRLTGNINRLTASAAAFTAARRAAAFVTAACFAAAG